MMDIKDAIIEVQRRLIVTYDNIDTIKKYPESHEKDRRIRYHEGARDALEGVLDALQEGYDGSKNN